MFNVEKMFVSIKRNSNVRLVVYPRFSYNTKEMCLCVCLWQIYKAVMSSIWFTPEFLGLRHTCSLYKTLLIRPKYLFSIHVYTGKDVNRYLTVNDC